MSSENWFARLNAGDQDAMEGLLNEYGAMMAYVVRGILTDPHEAEDCLAEVRAKLWEKAACYDGKKAGLSTWITALCRNAAYDRRRALARRASRAGALDPNAPDPKPGPEEEALRAERTAALRRALNTLSFPDQRLFYRKYYYLQSTAQMAAELGITERAMEGKLYRIRKKLQKQLGGDVL